MTPPHETRAEVAALVLETLARLGHPDLARNVRIEWNGRFTRRMGDAFYRKTPARGASGPECRLRFSVPLWPRASAAERRETVVHEVAHLVTYHEARERRSRPQSHGPEWRRVMARAGYPNPSRCHQVDRTGLKRTRRTVAVYCDCPAPTYVTPQLARRIRKGSYRCTRCQTSLGAASLEPRDRGNEDTTTAVAARKSQR